MGPKENNHKKSNMFQRIFHFPLLQIVIGIILVNVTTFILVSMMRLILSSLSIPHNTIHTVLIFCVRLITVYLAYTFFVRIFEKRKANEVSFDIPALKEFICGGLLGLFTISAVVLLMLLSGHLVITGLNRSATLFPSFLHNFFFAFLQDIVYFAILFRIVEKSLGSWIAIVIVSIVFGFKHLLFPGYTIWSVVAQTLETGILFSALFILTRNIWMIFGFHFVWNFIEYGFILGFDHESLVPLFNAEFSGPDLITGMPVGPEASIITCVIGTFIGLYFLITAHKMGCFILPFWKK